MDTQSEKEDVNSEVIDVLNDVLNQVSRASTFETYHVRNEEMIDISSDSSPDSSDSESSEESDFEADTVVKKEAVKKATVTKGELTVYDLPPIENLNIKLAVEELDHMGRIYSIIDVLVIVQSFKNKPVMNLDSVLFLKTGVPLGHIFDVFGPVSAPLYSVRFNSAQEIAQKNINIDAPVFYAPYYSSPITDYVFYQQLLAVKGSDASWKHNNEPPVECVDFSDDEEERIARMKLKAKRKFGDNPSYHVPPNTPNSPKQMLNNNSYFSTNSNTLSIPRYKI